MKRLSLSLLAGSMLLFAAACGNDNDEKTPEVDTMTTTPAMETTTPSAMPSGDATMGTDSMSGGASNTNDNTGRSMSTGTNAESGARNGRGNTTGQRGTGTNASGSQAAPVDPEAESTYPRAQPGAPVDGRMPVGTSK